MIRRFFELERNEDGIKIDNSYIFQDLGIRPLPGNSPGKKPLFS